MFVTKCGAKARTNENKPCRQPAMKNGRCRLHGGKSTGTKTENGKNTIIEANTKHGFYSAKAEAERKKIRKFLKESISSF